MRRYWCAEDLQLLRWLYPHVPTRKIAPILERSIEAVNGTAHKLGLHKTAAYLATPDACRLRRGDKIGQFCRFQPGNVPANKGTRRPGYAPGRMAETQFHKGQPPRNWLPIGSVRFSKEGYRQIKMTDTGYPPRDWVCEHLLLWRDVHGPVPAGHALCFKDGNKKHISIDNLEVITRGELMLRNTIHHLPPELKQLIFLNGVLKRKLREHDEKQDDASA
jgi:hypothetical protein